MKDITNLADMDAKQLRNLKINLNNRLQSFKTSETPKDLQKSHALYGLGKGQCEELLQKVRAAEKKLSHE